MYVCKSYNISACDSHRHTVDNKGFHPHFTGTYCNIYCKGLHQLRISIQKCLLRFPDKTVLIMQGQKNTGQKRRESVSLSFTMDKGGESGEPERTPPPIPSSIVELFAIQREPLRLLLPGDASTGLPAFSNTGYSAIPATVTVLWSKKESS